MFTVEIVLVNASDALHIRVRWDGVFIEGYARICLKNCLSRHLSKGITIIEHYGFEIDVEFTLSINLAPRRVPHESLVRQPLTGLEVVLGRNIIEQAELRLISVNHCGGQGVSITFNALAIEVAPKCRATFMAVRLRPKDFVL